MPKVSVIMPVLNGGKYLRDAVESILGQSFDDFEFIIINDGSTDDTEKIIKSYTDHRIVYIKNDKNLGLSRSFNIGINAAKGRYIARMDADDVSLPQRFATQLEFLKNNREVAVLGSGVTLIDERGRVLKRASKPLSHLGIKWQSLFSTPIFHPTVMARTEVLKDNPFDESLFNSEDYELWSRLLFDKGTRFENLPEALLFYRVFKSSFTQNLDPAKRAQSAQNSIKNIGNYISLTDRQKELITALRAEKKLSYSELSSIYYIYLCALWAFRRKERLSAKEFISIYRILLKFKISLFKFWVKLYLR